MIIKPETHHAYNAGVLDSEGYITVYERPHGHGVTVQVGISNTNLEMIRAFISYGGTVNTPRIRGLGTKPCYEWRAYSDNAKNTLENTLPYLKRLQRKARLALAMLKNTPQKGKHLTPKQVKALDTIKRQFKLCL